MMIFIFPISATEIIFIVLSVGFVWAAEFFNTAVEKTADLICPDKNPKIKYIKDISAAVVLVAAITAYIIGCIIFIPKIIHLC
jgi:diacylglycerol kinase